MDLKVGGKSPWLTGIKKISLPIAHGEGCYVVSKKEYIEMKKKKQISLTYEKGEICKFQNLEANPNGANFDVAGVNAYNGRVFGMMPHPERAMFIYQNPLWQKNKKYIAGKDGAGLQIFKNAINYFRK